MWREVLKEKWVWITCLIAVLFLTGVYIYTNKEKTVTTSHNYRDTTQDIKEADFKQGGTTPRGGVAMYGDIEFVITGAKICKSIEGIGNDHVPELGQYVVVDLEGKNTGTTRDNSYASCFKVSNTDGQEYREDTAVSMWAEKKNHSMWGDAFNPGSKKSFRLVFDVPPGELNEYKIQIDYRDGVAYMSLA
jgi:hypothetical protein